jgi:tetratricopeptide (TPR) repeat protein
MKERILQLAADAESRNAAVKTEAAVGLIRIVLQHVCLSLAEWIIDRFHSTANLVQNQEVDLSELRAPSEGTLVDVMLNLIVVAENLGWTGLAKTMWSPVPAARSAAKFSSYPTATLESILRGYVAWRNNEVFGHGLPNEEYRGELLDVVRLLVERCEAILPQIGDAGRHAIRGPSGEILHLKVLRSVGGDLVCYRQIRMVSNGRCVVRAQRQVSLEKSEDVAWEAEDILAFRARDDRTYSLWETGDVAWCPLVMIPGRLTHHFRGRKSEISQLTDWVNDTDSRACMLYGDGGMGKTTLALEFVHRLLDGGITSNWKPEMVTFYTAKQTVWGIDGVKYIRASAGTVNDLAAEVYRTLSGEVADRAWFDRPADAVVDKLAGYLAEWRIDRKKHLLVLDNTETMAADDDEIRALANHVLRLARKVGRILITSRRREPIEARLIEVPAFEPDESVALLRSRATELGRQPILQAGDAKLRQIAAKLGNRPLTLEVFLQTLSDDRIGLDRAFERVLRMERQDLGEFLYADAWRRFVPRIQALLLFMTRVSDVHDEALIKLCCQQAGVVIMDAYDALSGSRGIASVSRIDGHIQVVLNNDFLQFSEGKEVRVDGNVMPTTTAIDTIKRRYIEFLKGKSARVQSRVSVAFRTPYARMAYQAFKEGRYDECENAYEMAVAEDADNGALYDRYAYALFTMRRFEDALSKAKEATRFAPTDGECWFTRGLIESRLGDAAAAESSLARARAHGKAGHLCHLQLAHAYANSVPPRVADGFAALVGARQIDAPEPDDLKRKHLGEVRMLEYRLARFAAPRRRDQ